MLMLTGRCGLYTPALYYSRMSSTSLHLTQPLSDRSSGRRLRAVLSPEVPSPVDFGRLKPAAGGTGKLLRPLAQLIGGGEGIMTTINGQGFICTQLVRRLRTRDVPSLGGVVCSDSQRQLGKHCQEPIDRRQQRRDQKIGYPRARNTEGVRWVWIPLGL